MSPKPVRKTIGQARPALGQPALEPEAVEVGQVHVEHQALRAAAPSCARKASAESNVSTSRPSPRSSRERAFRTSASSSTMTDGVRRSLMRVRAGSATQKVAPRSELLAALKRAAVRLDDRAADRQPHPHAAGLGGPERIEDALHVARADPAARVARPRRARRGRPWRRCAPTRSRSVSLVSSIASAAFMTRLRKTCWSWTRLRVDGGKRGRELRDERDVAGEELVARELERVARAARSRRSARSGTSSRRNSAFSRRITSTARWSARTMSPQISRSSARSSGSRPSSCSRRFGVGEDRGERLVQLVRDRRGELAQGRDARHVAQRRAVLLGAELRLLALGDVARHAEQPPALAALVGAAVGREPAHLAVGSQDAVLDAQVLVARRTPRSPPSRAPSRSAGCSGPSPAGSVAAELPEPGVSPAARAARPIRRSLSPSAPPCDGRERRSRRAR